MPQNIVSLYKFEKFNHIASSFTPRLYICIHMVFNYKQFSGVIIAKAELTGDEVPAAAVGRMLDTMTGRLTSYLSSSSYKLNWGKVMDDWRLLLGADAAAAAADCGTVVVL